MVSLGIGDYLRSASAIVQRATGNAIVFCKNCGEKETFKLLNTNGDHTYKCACGCSVYKLHNPDKFHDYNFFVKTFIPAKEYDPEYKIKKADNNGFKEPE